MVSTRIHNSGRLESIIEIHQGHWDTQGSTSWFYHVDCGFIRNNHGVSPRSTNLIHKVQPLDPSESITLIHQVDSPGSLMVIIRWDPTESSSIHPLDPPGSPIHNCGNPALGFTRLHHWDPQWFKHGYTRIHNVDPPGSSMWFHQDSSGSTTGIHQDPPRGSTT